MALRKIVEQGESCLTKKCRSVMEFNSRLHMLLDDLVETLAEAGGAGLAAPQVGVLRRACVVMDEETGDFIELVNPEFSPRVGSRSDLRVASASQANGDW